MKRKILTTIALACLSLVLLNTACGDDDKDNTIDIVSLSTTEVTVKVGESFSVDITLTQTDRVKTIVVEKTIEGKKVASYNKTLNVADMQFPYTFTEMAIPEDEEGVVVYSFYGMDAGGAQVDASDIIMKLNVTQLYRLLKYDWRLASQMIQKEDYAEAYMKDDVNRFHADLSWESDWGTVLSTSQLETLDSYCAWKMIGTDEKIDSIYLIKYNIFAPTDVVITKYKVEKFNDKELVLQSIQNLSDWGFDVEEPVLETFAGISKSPDFTPYRGQNPDSYIVAACRPGSY